MSSTPSLPFIKVRDKTLMRTSSIPQPDIWIPTFRHLQTLVEKAESLQK
jgi:hypothetical protein